MQSLSLLRRGGIGCLTRKLDVPKKRSTATHRKEGSDRINGRKKERAISPSHNNAQVGQLYCTQRSLRCLPQGGINGPSSINGLGTTSLTTDAPNVQPSRTTFPFRLQPRAPTVIEWCGPSGTHVHMHVESSVLVQHSRVPLLREQVR